MEDQLDSYDFSEMRNYIENQNKRIQEAMAIKLDPSCYSVPNSLVSELNGIRNALYLKALDELSKNP